MLGKKPPRAKASVLPEQFTFGNIGGWFATELKYAGYDGFIIEGKSEEHVFIKIEDDKIEILPADDLWGMRVHQTQKALEDQFGHEFKSMVIGPAGENLVRIASITTSNDCAFAKGGFGAVWGSKGLKAVTVHGTGMEADVENTDFIRTFIDNMVYRKGYYGNLFAEGMARAIREMGYDKYSETVYHGRHSQMLGGQRLDIPVSLEGGWGQSVHWQGRGYEGSVEKPTWLAACIIRMLSTRDANTVEHFHSEFEYHAEAMADPYHSPNLIRAIINVQNNAEIKDSVMSCEWQSPDPW